MACTRPEFRELSTTGPLSHGLVVHKLVMISYPNAELHNDPSNWWGPNPAAVIAMLKSVGFSRVKAWSYIARR
jgi:hypothetical protein